ncbi:hypothetical protein [Aureivirga marina]|uniref:hypothetical protein n=1 Tax=Aureivirga marina TaxID=1182451 RepID=UPI0018CAEE54|nr:hypothetical protein [Aureivirga marina]
MKKLILFICLSFFFSNLKAQEKDYSAYTKDINSTINTLYEVISGPAGKKRDWNLFLHLYHPKANLIHSVRSKTGKDSLVFISPREFSETHGIWMEKNGFFEREIHRTQNVFGTNAQVFTTYEIRMTKEQEKPTLRGINNIQLYYENGRWYVLTVYWLRETAENPIPKEYLPKN